MVRSVYFDSAASFPPRREAVEAMVACMEEAFANPSSPHPLGKAARDRLTDARSVLAASLRCDPGELVLTSGGTESNNLAILGSVLTADAGDHRSAGGHLLISAIEHKSVIEAATIGSRFGVEVERVNPTSSGMIDPEAVVSRIRRDTRLVSVMMVNNELGVREPVEEIGTALRKRGVRFHVDAVQALGKVPVCLSELPVDLASFSAHKVGGPKGCGALYLRSGVRLAPQIVGGPQERGFRAGTENVAGAVGFAEAARLAVAELDSARQTMVRLRTRFEVGLAAAVGQHVDILGQEAERAPHISMVSFRHVDSNYLLRQLHRAGICATSGSACQSTSQSPSHVLLACAVPRNLAHAAVRFSFSPTNTDEEVEYALGVLQAVHRDLGLTDGSAGHSD